MTGFISGNMVHTVRSRRSPDSRGRFRNEKHQPLKINRFLAHAIASGFGRLNAFVVLMKRKLIYKLMALILPLILASVVFTSLVLSLNIYRIFRQNISENYRHILKTSAGQVEMYTNTAKSDLETLALMIAALNLNPWQQEMALAAFMQLHPQFLDLSLKDSDGNSAAGCENTEKSAPVPAVILNKTRSGRIGVSGAGVDENHLPLVHMGVPVQRQGEVSGILYGQLNLKTIWNLLIDIQIGRTGRISVLDSDGVTIGHPQITEVTFRRQIRNPDVLKELSSPGQIVEWTETGDQGSRLCLAIRLVDPDWVIMLSQDFSESNIHFYRHIAWTVFLTLIMILIAGILSWNTCRSFLDPIHALHRQVNEISRGDLQSKTSIAADDEIADLGRAFNEMVDSLQKHIVHEVEQARQLVHARNLAELGTTASKVAHEVGNLLNNIGLAVMTLNSESMSPKGQKALELLKNDAVRIQKFIEDFLRFAKKPELRLRPMPLHPLILEALSAHEPQAQPANIRFEVDWPQNIPPVPVDAEGIYQVFSNLIKNSLQAMQASGGVIRISATLEPEHLLMRFEDTGPGIEEQNLSRIFQPFFTTKGKQGTGLGLSVVKSIIEAHRGTISCRRRTGAGAEFVLRLPLR